MGQGTTDASSVPWPYWMLRYVGSDDPSALHDLIWSVGGSPPYGGTPYEEAKAVYELVERHRQPSAVPAAAFEAVSRLVKDPAKRGALELFRIRDRIASAPDSFSDEDLAAGQQLAKQLNDQGCQAYFAMLESQRLHQAGDIPAARQVVGMALAIFASLSLTDVVYRRHMLGAAVNSASFAMMDADHATAREMLKLVEGFGEDVMRGAGVHGTVQQLRSLLGGRAR